ncbi:MAG: hypothetical protein Q9M82_00965 [Mariprofundus sp.]|nr:hypothetical protein [Mariprofundus sp.]
MRIFWFLSLSIALAGLAWLAWQSPLPAPVPDTVQKSLPPYSTNAHKIDGTGQQKTQLPQVLWRVITHRVLSREGIAAMHKRLLAMQLKPVSIQSMEDVTMHAFDDATLFKTSKQAHTMARFWQQHGIETNVIRAAKGVYLVGLGRLYQTKYAEDMQKKLDRVGRKYRYQQRIVPIPVRRFTFAPSDRKNAEILWKKLSLTGVMMPVLMAETEFQETYGNSIQP